jgi:enoyl-CoA hydratase
VSDFPEAEQNPMNYETILTERRGRVAIVTLNRPARLNALNMKLVGELS